MTELRRSISDPTDLSLSRLSPRSVLQRCSSLVTDLNQRVEAASLKLRCRTLEMAAQQGIGCKRCHGPVGKPGQHQGSRTGYKHCTLPHDPTCPGLVKEVPGKIAPCPAAYVLGTEFPESAVIPREGSQLDDESYDSATSKTSFSSQQTEDLVSDSNGNESDAERNSTLRMKNDQTAMDNGMNLFLPGLLNNGAMGFNSNNAVTTSVTITGATMSSCSSSTTTTQAASSPIPTPANSGNSETNILMNFIQQQMLDLRLQVRTEVSQVLTENEKQQKQNQEALQQQLEAVQRQVQKVQPSSNDRRVQFGNNIDNVVQAADNLRATMQSDPKKRSMPENLISMQDIRKTQGLACQVEDRMQSVYAIQH